MNKLEVRFWAKVDKAGGSKCWNWQGAKSPTGYGHFVVDGKTKNTHRFSWEITYGEIPFGLCVCHRCDNPTCVRPDHLFLGTISDNAQDMARKGRGRSSKHIHTCKRGHEFTPENTYYKNGRRHCRECRRLWKVNYRMSKRNSDGYRKTFNQQVRTQPQNTAR